jgi:parvulin-like peptidyl-prolyl isomerase
LTKKLLEEFDFPVDELKTQVHAAHILVEIEEEALAALARIEQGEEFEMLAAELSTDSSNAYKGGDLGWFSSGQMVPEFEDAAFSLPIGEISSPVKTDFGWHIIKVYDHTEVPTTSQEQNQQRQRAFEELVTGWRLVADITTEDITPYIPKLP